MRPIENEEHADRSREAAEAQRAGDQPTTGGRSRRQARGIAGQPPEAPDGQGAAGQNPESHAGAPEQRSDEGKPDDDHCALRRYAHTKLTYAHPDPAPRPSRPETGSRSPPRSPVQDQQG